tara:strand:- start:131 stop:568 length:438 start_codon:yes stop_codon:yes gene_type:complete
MGQDKIVWNIDDDEQQKKDDCKSSNGGVVFGRSLLKNMAGLFGFGHAVDYNKYGDTDVNNLHNKIQNEIERHKWVIIQQIFKKNIETNQAVIEELNNLLQILDDQVYYFENTYDPKFEDIDMIDNCRITLLFAIIFVLIMFIDWK